MRRTLGALGLATLIAACGDNGAEPCRSAACGRHLRDADGRALVLRGVNFAGSHKIAPYTDDFQPEHYAQLHAWGFRTLRFIITWSAIEPQPGSYNDAYLDWVAERMQWAQDAGLTVVLDMHQDVYGEGFGFDGAPRWTCDASYYAAFTPNENWILNYGDANVLACYDHLWSDATLQSSYANMWGHVAERLANQPAIIGIDPMNEPHWGTSPIPSFEATKLQPLYALVIDAVRAHAPWFVFAEPSASRNLGFASKLEPFTQPNIIYAPHMYDATAELSGEFDATHRNALLSTAMDLAADAERLNTPLWIGEYGGISTSPQIGPYMDAAYDGAASAFAGTMYWAFDRGGGYSMLDAAGNEVTPLIDAIVRPYPERIAGDPIEWTYDEAARALTVQWQPDTSISAPTVIVAPARVYPNGVDVACEGCTATVHGDEIEILASGPKATATVTPR
ncbi:MAG TPA: cellulase family glycosylhydrolase [Kofleriaceae bacterium]